MRNFILCVVAGVFIAGIGERLTKGLDGKAPAAGQTVATASSGSEGARRASAPTNDGPSKLTVTADRDGHFRVSGMVNGRHMSFMVDTGASVIALTQRDADRLQIKAQDRIASVQTANGTVMASAARLATVEIGNLSVRDVQAVILPGRALSENLLGMSFLSRLGRFEIRNKRLVLEQ